MSIHHFPGNFRLGVLNELRNGVLEPGPRSVDPKLMVLVLLSGWQRFRIGAQIFDMDARQLPDALILRIGKSYEMEYLHNWGQPLTKLSLAMPLDWLDSAAGRGDPGLLDLGDGLSAQRFLPGPDLMEIARAILICDSKLSRMALGMGLLEQCLAGLGDDSPHALAIVPLQRGDAGIVRLRRLIAAAPDGLPLTAQALARASGIGLRSLERQVRDTEGTSLGALIREARLEAGLRALRAGDQVTQAAARAGYSSATNFAAAVRRRYGASPRQLRHGPTSEAAS